MRITYIHQHFKRPDEAGGSRPWEQARRLAADGHEVLMVTGGDKSRSYVESGFRVRQLRAPYTNSLGFLGRLVSFARFAVSAVTVTVSSRADLVIASSTPLTVAVPALVTKAIRRVPFVFEVRDLWPAVPVQLGELQNQWLIRAAQGLERLTYAQAHSIIALSPGMAEGVRTVSPGVEVTIVPNGADLDRFWATETRRKELRAELGWTDQIIVVYAGSFGVIYELKHLVSIARHLQSGPIRLILIGDGTLMPRLQLQARVAGLDPAHVLVGRAPKTEVARYVAAADAVISSVRDVPALHPSSLNKVFDGLAAGRPVVFTHSGWLSNLVCDSAAGFRIDSSDSRLASEQLTKGLADPARRAAMGQAAADLARTTFDRERLYTKFRSVVEDAATGHHFRRTQLTRERPS